MTISTRPPWSDNREAQTNETTSGIGGDEPIDDERSVSSPELTNRTSSMSSAKASLQPLSGGKLC